MFVGTRKPLIIVAYNACTCFLRYQADFHFNAQYVRIKNRFYKIRMKIKQTIINAIREIYLYTCTVHKYSYSFHLQKGD